MPLYHRVMAYRHTNANRGAAPHQDPWPDYGSGQYGDEILKYRIPADHRTLPDSSVLTDPHASLDDGVTVNPHLAAIEERPERVADDRGLSYVRSGVDRGRIIPNH